MSSDSALLPVIADAEVTASDISLKQAKELQALEPFGLQNPVPLLLLSNAQVLDVQPLSNGKHIKLRIKHSDRVLNAVYFGMRYSEFQYHAGDICDFLFTLEASEFRGVCEAKLFIKKVRQGVQNGQENGLQMSYYMAAVDEDNRDDLPASVLPSLLQFRAVFRILKREAGAEKKRFALSYLQRLLKEDDSNVEISLCALRIMFDVLVECGLAACEFSGGGAVVTVKLLPFSGKVNLDRSPLLLRIREKHRLY